MALRLGERYFIPKLGNFLMYLARIIAWLARLAPRWCNGVARGDGQLVRVVTGSFTGT